jgi:hypothetical protein
MRPLPRPGHCYLRCAPGQGVVCAAALLGGSKTTVTLLFPQAGQMRRDSSRDSGKFGQFEYDDAFALA